MSKVYPLTVCRSDGLIDTTTRDGITEANSPAATQQNQAPKADGSIDYYQRIENDDLKALDWRRKLGGMLMNVLGTKEHDGLLYYS